MERIVFVMPDQSVQIVQPVAKGRREGESPMDWLQRIAERTRPPEAVGQAHVISVQDLPKGNKEAWVWNGQKVVIDQTRIKPPRAKKVQAAADGSVDIAALISELRQDVAAHMQDSYQAMMADLQRWVIRSETEKNYALNALRSDEEAPEGVLRDAREKCRASLARMGAPEGKSFEVVAREILARVEANGDAVMP
jgi:hypothetical protein